MSCHFGRQVSAQAAKGGNTLGLLQPSSVSESPASLAPLPGHVQLPVLSESPGGRTLHCPACPCCALPSVPQCVTGWSAAVVMTEHGPVHTAPFPHDSHLYRLVLKSKPRNHLGMFSRETPSACCGHGNWRAESRNGIGKGCVQPVFLLNT